jgi:hypothetical protein
MYSRARKEDGLMEETSGIFFSRTTTKQPVLIPAVNGFSSTRRRIVLFFIPEKFPY